MMGYNVTMMIDGYAGQEHSFPVYPLYEDVTALAAETLDEVYSRKRPFEPEGWGEDEPQTTAGELDFSARLWPLSGRGRPLSRR